MPTPTLPQQWQDIGTAHSRAALSDSIDELRRIDYDIDSSFEASMWAIADAGNDCHSSEAWDQAEIREALRVRKYEIMLGLFAGLGERKRHTQEG